MTKAIPIHHKKHLASVIESTFITFIAEAAEEDVVAGAADAEVGNTVEVADPDEAGVGPDDAGNKVV